MSVAIEDIINLLPEKHKNLQCFIFNETTSIEQRKKRINNYLDKIFNETNTIKNFDGHSTNSYILHFINLDIRLINKKYTTDNEKNLHMIELLFHEFQHAYQVTYEGKIDINVNTIDNPLEIEADKFAKEQMLLNIGKLAELLKIDEGIIERFANDIRKNKGAVD